jgi:hypothetical protein
VLLLLIQLSLVFLGYCPIWGFTYFGRGLAMFLKSLLQDQELPVESFRSKHFTWRWGYARSADSHNHNDPGQDFIVFDYQPEVFTFALCDGVSQSFLGDLAARYLGTNLVAWLKTVPRGLDVNEYRSLLGAQLTCLVPEAEAQVQRFPLPDSISPMLRVVLEKKRKLGSETTFVCACVSLPDADFPRGWLLLAWMGDSRLRVWNRSGEVFQEYASTFQTMQRWSTSRGAVGGDLHVYASHLMDENGKPVVQRLLAYSDGLASLDKDDLHMVNSHLQGVINCLWDSPSSDDVSILDLWLDASPEILASTLLAEASSIHFIEQERKIEENPETQNNILDTDNHDTSSPEEITQKLKPLPPASEINPPKPRRKAWFIFWRK